MAAPTASPRATHPSSQDPRPAGLAVRTLFALGTAAAKYLIEQHVAARAEVQGE